MVKKLKKQKDSINMLLKTRGIKNILMFCLIKKWWDIKWREFKVNCIKLELMFVKFLGLVLMIKDKY